MRLNNRSNKIAAGLLVVWLAASLMFLAAVVLDEEWPDADMQTWVFVAAVALPVLAAALLAVFLLKCREPGIPKSLMAKPGTYLMPPRTEEPPPVEVENVPEPEIKGKMPEDIQ